MAQLHQFTQQQIFLYTFSPTFAAQLQHSFVCLLILLLAIDIVFYNGFICELFAHIGNPFPITHVSQISNHTMFFAC